jgi:hypothetical protein
MSKYYLINQNFSLGGGVGAVHTRAYNCVIPFITAFMISLRNRLKINAVLVFSLIAFIFFIFHVTVHNMEQAKILFPSQFKNGKRQGFYIWFVNVKVTSKHIFKKTKKQEP